MKMKKEMRDFLDGIMSEDVMVEMIAEFWRKEGKNASKAETAESATGARAKASVTVGDMAAFEEDLALDAKKKSRAAALSKRGALKNLDGAETVKDAGGFFDK